MKQKETADLLNIEVEKNRELIRLRDTQESQIKEQDLQITEEEKNVELVRLRSQYDNLLAESNQKDLDIQRLEEKVLELESQKNVLGVQLKQSGEKVAEQVLVQMRSQLAFNKDINDLKLQIDEQKATIDKQKERLNRQADTISAQKKELDKSKEMEATHQHTQEYNTKLQHDVVELTEKLRTAQAEQETSLKKISEAEDRVQKLTTTMRNSTEARAVEKQKIQDVCLEVFLLVLVNIFFRIIIGL